MLAFAVLLAIVEVSVTSQIDFWGVVPVAFSVVAYMFRWEADIVELLAAATAYGFVVSIFKPNSDALWLMLALFLATAVSLATIRGVAKTRIRIMVRGYDALIIAVSFTLTYWLVTSARLLGEISLARLVIFMLWSTTINLALILVAGVINRRLVAG